MVDVFVNKDACFTIFQHQIRPIRISRRIKRANNAFDIVYFLLVCKPDVLRNFSVSINVITTQVIGLVNDEGPATPERCRHVLRTLIQRCIPLYSRLLTKIPLY